MTEQMVQMPRTVEAALSVEIATTEEDILAAQRLRYKVFHDEMGARLCSGESGFDQDMFDPYCEHLIVRDQRTAEVVGTYRILSAEQAQKVGGFYSETEFDLTRLASLMPSMAEVGRSCVHPQYRNGATIFLLWSGLTKYLLERGCECVIGCASVETRDGGHKAASIYARLKDRFLGPESERVTPFYPLPLRSLRQDMEMEIPPLIKGYLRLGAVVCGEPAWDTDFNTADFLTLIHMRSMSPRYARRLLRA